MDAFVITSLPFRLKETFQTVGPFAPRALPLFIAQTDPSATLSPSIDFPVLAELSSPHSNPHHVADMLRELLSGEFPDDVETVMSELTHVEAVQIKNAPNAVMKPAVCSAKDGAVLWLLERPAPVSRKPGNRRRPTAHFKRKRKVK